LADMPGKLELQYLLYTGKLFFSTIILNHIWDISVFL